MRLTKGKNVRALYEYMYNDIQALHARLCMLGTKEPTIVQLMNQDEDMVELACTHEVHADGQIHMLAFLYNGVPVTTYHITQLQNGGMQVSARYNHNETGVLLPMPEHDTTFQQLPPLSDQHEQFITYSFILPENGTAYSPQASHKYEDRRPNSNGDFRSVPLPIPTTYPNNYLPFMGHVVHQLQTAVTAISTSA